MPPVWLTWPNGMAWRPTWKSITTSGTCFRFTAVNSIALPKHSRWRPNTSGVIWQADITPEQGFFTGSGPAFHLPLQLQCPAAVTGRCLEFQDQRPFTPQAARAFGCACLMLGKAAFHIGGDAGIQASGRGTYQIEKPVISHGSTPAPSP